MEKKRLAALTLVGISAGLALGGCQKPPERQRMQKVSVQEMDSKMQGFYDSLSPEAQKKFSQMDAQHQRMAVDSGTPHACDSPHGCPTNPTREDRNNAVEKAYQDQFGSKS